MAEQMMGHRSRICKNCSREFPVTTRTGRTPEHCGAECRVAYQVSRRTPKSEWPLCATAGCGGTVRARSAKVCNACYSLKAKRAAGVCGVSKCSRPATRVGHGLCEVHYTRVRRNGSPDLTPRIERQEVSGYMQRKAAGHPVAGKNGWAFEHRLVVYEDRGKGPHPCHWCGRVLFWRELVIDHLNEVKHDNRLENLVVSCVSCNRARGAMIPFIAKMQAHRIPDLIATFDHMRAGVGRKQAMERRGDR